MADNCTVFWRLNWCRTGALNLHDLTRDRDLDFFLLASATDPVRQLRARARTLLSWRSRLWQQERRALDFRRPARAGDRSAIVAILRATKGFATRCRATWWTRTGVRMEASATHSMRCCATCAPRLGFLELDWNVLRRFLPAAQAPKFSELTRHDGASTTGHETTQDLRRRLAELPEAELLSTVTDIVRGEIAQILRIAPERIEPGVSLLDIGMDSLMAVELATSIEGRLGVQLSALALSDAPTIERASRARIAQQLRPNGDDGSHVDTGGDARWPPGAC